MIDFKKIRRDNINYGAIKVYEWTVSVDMTDVESITDVFLHEKQLIDIFNNKYDILTAIIELVDPETREVLFRIQNKFYKTDVVDTENSICYASPVNLEEYITQLVFTKEPAGETIELLVQNDRAKYINWGV